MRSVTGVDALGVAAQYGGPCGRKLIRTVGEWRIDGGTKAEHCIAGEESIADSEPN